VGRGTNEAAEFRKGAGFGLGHGDSETFVADFANRRIENVSTQWRVLIEERPARVVVATSGCRADKSQPFWQIALTLRSGAASALKKQNPLIGEPEVLSESNLVSLVVSDEPVEHKSQPLRRLSRGRGVRFVREALDQFSDAPGSKKGGREELRNERQRELLFDVGEITPESFFCGDLVYENVLPGDPESLRPVEKHGNGIPRGGKGLSETRTFMITVAIIATGNRH